MIYAFITSMDMAYLSNTFLYTVVLWVPIFVVRGKRTFRWILDFVGHGSIKLNIFFCQIITEAITLLLKNLNENFVSIGSIEPIEC